MPVRVLRGEMTIGESEELTALAPLVVQRERQGDEADEACPDESFAAYLRCLVLINDMTLSGVTRRTDARIEPDVQSPGHFR